MTKKRRYPNVTSFLDRHGKLRWRWRKTGCATYYFRHPPDTPGFNEELEACQACEPINIGAGRVKPRSVSDVLNRYYQSSDFNGGGPADRSRRRLLLESFRDEFGDDLIANFRFDHIEAVLNRRTQKRVVGRREFGGNFAAHSLRKQLRRLFAYAARLGWIAQNPVDLAGKVKIPKTGGYHIWSQTEVHRYRECHAVGTMARLAMEIMFWTGMRRGDARLLAPENVRNGSIEYHQSKTGKLMKHPVVPPLQEAFSAMKTVGLKTFLVTEFGRPFSAAGFGNKMREWCDEAGLPQCTAHGLRKALTTCLAEVGATQQELKAVGGWSGDAEVARYAAGASQEALARAAMSRLVGGTLANPATGLANQMSEDVGNAD